MRMRAPRPRERRGIVSASAPLVLVLVLTLAAFLAAQASDATTVLYVYDNDDASAVPQYVAAARELDHVDRVALQMLHHNNDHAFLAIDRRSGGDASVAGEEEFTVRIGGRGRRRSDGVSILRAQDQSDADSSAVVFTPLLLDVSWVETCLPTMHNVRAENRGKTPLRIDGIRFDHDAFSLASDPRGVVLEPSQSIQISVIFVSGQPEQLRAFMFLQTSQGEFALPVRGHTKPSPHGLVGLRVSVPTGARLEHTIRFHNPSDRGVRVSEAFSLDGIGDIVLPFSARSSSNSQSVLSMWEIESLSTKPIARFIFKADKPPGRYQSSVRVVTPNEHFVVPIQIDVRENQFSIEPSEIDVGVFTNDHERRDVTITFHNTASRPVAIHALCIAELDGMDVSVELLGAPIIPPRSRVTRAIMLKSRSANSSVRTDQQRRSGPCGLKVHFETNASASNSFHTVQLRGFSTRGHLSYSLDQTTSRIAASEADTSSESTSPPGHAKSTANLAETGISLLRELVLTNGFDTALELESVSMYPSCPDATVEAFTRGVAAPALPFPTISIRVRPDAALHPHTRVCSLQVETNATIHQVPIVVYSGIAGVKSSRPVTKGGNVNLPPCGSLKKTDGDSEFDVKHCRQVVLEMGKVAVEGMLEEVVNITDTSPTELRVSIRSTVSDYAVFQAFPTTSFYPDPHLPVELAALGVAWQQSNSTRKRAAGGDAGAAVASEGGFGPEIYTYDDTMSPGELMSVKIGMYFDNQGTGTFVEPVVLIETQFEMIEVFVRLETVEGTVEPDVRRIEIQDIHPGRLGYVRVPFTSTFQHDVSTRGSFLRHNTNTNGNGPQRDVFAVWRLPKVFPANATSYVTLMYFPADFYAACRRGRFFADCFAPSAAASPSLSPDFSGYGSLVAASDIERLEKRELHWTENANNYFDRRVKVDLSIMTDTLNTNVVHVVTSMARPRFFRNDVSITGVNFPLTELLQQVAAYVNVFNPSDYAMDMELAIAEHDRHLFYECDDDMTEVECLREWQDIARERVEMAKQIRNGSSSAKTKSTAFAPMFFKPRTVRVVGQGYTQLGPIYFFPSTVGDWKTRLFVRNELTHIEPFAVAGSSGFGQLTFSLRGKGQSDETSVATPLPNGDEIRFATSQVEELPDSNATTLSFRSVKTLVIANTGTFQTALNSVRLFDMKGSKKTKAFAFTATGAVDSSGQLLRFWAVQDFVLEPQQELRFEIEFTTDCFRSRRETEMQITTRDGVTSHRLVGLLSADASFQCRRQLWTKRRAQLMDWLWVTSSSVGCVVVLLAMWTLVHSRRKQLITNRMPVVSSDKNVMASKARLTEEVDGDGDAELIALLTRMEQSSFVPPVEPRVVAPTVGKLRATRQRKNGKLLLDDKPEGNGKIVVPAIASIEKDEIAEPAKRITPKARNHTQSKSCSPRVMREVESNSPRKPSEEANESPLRDNQCEADVEVKTPEQSKIDLRGPIAVVPPKTNESVKKESKEEKEIKKDTRDEVVVSDKDLSMREDTASEEESDDQQEETENSTLVEVAATIAPPVEQSPSSSLLLGDSPHNSEEDDGVVLVGMQDVDEFTLPIITTEGSLLQPHATEGRDSLGFDDDWSALSFDMLQSEIGKLFVADDGPFDATADMRTSHVGDVNGTLSSLNSLSMAPPLLPMSSLFGSAVPSLVPPQPRTKTTRAAPPGFSPADANPEASRAAFERLLQPAPTPDPFALSASDTTSSLQSAFSGRYSLFGPHLSQASSSGGSSGLFHSATSAVPNGRIGGGRVARSPLPTASRGALEATRGGRDSGVASLGGVDLPADDASMRAIGGQAK